MELSVVMSGRVPIDVEVAYLAYLGSSTDDALAKWATFRDLCHDAFLDPVETARLVTFGGNLRKCCNF